MTPVPATTNTPSTERRQADPSAHPRLQGALAMGVGLLLVLPSAAWGLVLLWGVFGSDANPRLLYLLGLPAFVAGCGALACYYGLCSLRSDVPSLDRRKGTS